MLLSVAAFTLISIALASASHPGITKCDVGSSIPWQSCSIFRYNDTLDAVKPQCGYFTVPADYKNCSAGTVRLAVARRPANVKPRLGTLFVNPGGPGVSGTSFILNEEPSLGSIAGDRHDIVLWDPRAVGFTSLQINCFNSADEEAPYFQPDSILSFGPQAKGNFTNPHHSDPDEVAFWMKANETDTFLDAIASKCLENNGDNLKYVGTVAVVRDMLSLADAIDGHGKPINYWGLSYGTAIGSYFVNMFPRRVGRVIIDGVVNPTWWAQDLPYAGWSKSIQDVMLIHDEFTRACAEAGPKYCPLATANSTQADIAAWLQGLMDFAYEHPVGELTSAAIRFNIFSSAMYYPNTWGDDAQAFLQIYDSLVAAANTSATIETWPYPTRSGVHRSSGFTHPISPSVPRQSRRIVSASSDAPPQRRSVSRRDDPNFDFFPYIMAIMCGDSIDAPDVKTKDAFGEIVRAADTVSQMFGPQWFVSLYCHKWPARAVERYQGPWNHTLSNKILVIGNKGDPITPLISAKAVADTLGPKNAVLLQRDGYGHTSIAEESICTNKVISNYLVHGKLPARGTVCATNKNYFGSPNVSSNSSASWTAQV